MASPNKKPLKILLATHNTCGVYDDRATRLPLWLDRLESLVARHKIDFLAVHMQEVGGSSWKKGGLDHVQPFADAIAAKFANDYWCTGLLCEATPDSTFTALGSIYLVLKASAERVSMWAAASDDDDTGAFRSVASFTSPLVSPPTADARYCCHAQMPPALFGEGNKVSRKGYLLTSWSFDGRQCIDLLNVHNLHDASNWVALEEPSIYAARRQKCLHHVLRERDRHSFVEHQLSREATALFVFGDFNFRLSLGQVVRHLCGADGVEAARALREKAEAAAAAEAEAKQAAEATEKEATKEAKEGDDEKKAKPAAVALPAADAQSSGDAEGVAIHMSDKKFRLGRPETIIEHFSTFLQFDNELAAYTASAVAGAAEAAEGGGGADGGGDGAATPLFELPIEFPPSYSYDDSAGGDRFTLRRGTTAAEEGLEGLLAAGGGPAAEEGGGVGGGGGGSSASLDEDSERSGLSLEPYDKSLCKLMAAHFGPKRCPAWCDRVLMDGNARALVCGGGEGGGAKEGGGGGTPSFAPVYATDLQRTVLTDHNMVYLVFEVPA